MVERKHVVKMRGISAKYNVGVWGQRRWEAYSDRLQSDIRLKNKFYAKDVVNFS